MKKSANRAPHVLVTIPTANFTQRIILEGVLSYARDHGPWNFHLNTGDIAAQGLGSTRAWGCDGIISLSSNPELLARLAAARVPMVVINPPPGAKIPRRRDIVTVRRDNRNLGRLAAEYFLERKYRSFAFIGSPRQAYWSDERRAGYAAAIERAGHVLAVYPQPTSEECRDFSLEAPRLGDFLASLPKPTALFTVKDMRGQQILACALDRGIDVPGELAVLSTDNDEVLCKTTTPELSSIELDGSHTGRLCAEILDRLLAGHAVRALVDIAYPRIITRRSSDAFTIDDPVLARAVAEIRKDLSRPLHIKNLAAILGVSTRTLEIKSARHFGTPLKTAILRLRLSEAIARLTNSTDPLSVIAESCGFANASHLSRAVKAAFGYPPGVFRARTAVY